MYILSGTLIKVLSSGGGREEATPPQPPQPASPANGQASLPKSLLVTFYHTKVIIYTILSSQSASMYYTGVEL